jgi:hypothetical protein
MAQLTQEGQFRGEITASAVRPPNKDSAKQAVMIGMKFLINEIWEDGEWKDWAEHQMEAFGDFCVIKNDGTVQESNAKMLQEVCGWDGNLDLKDFLPGPVQFRVTSEEYKGKTSYRVAFIDPYEGDARSGGTVKGAEDSDIKRLNAKHRSALKACLGNKKSSPPKAAGKPSGPPPASGSKKKAPPVAPPEDEAPEATREEAWDALVATCPKMTNDELFAKWAENIEESMGNKTEKTFTPADWGKVKEICGIPF